MWQNLNSKTHIVTKLKNSKFYQTQKLKFWQNSKTKIAKKFQNLNCDSSERSKNLNSVIKILPEKIVTQIVTKLDGSNSDGSNCEIF